MTAVALSAARVLLIIGGGVSAYKSLEVIRRLRERGAAVRVVMTAAAKQFVSPLSAAALSGAPVRDDLFSLVDEAEMGHIELSRAADLIVVAPATADLLARMAHGLANDLASTTLLATDKRVLVAPAMNVRMWLHKATQRNVATLAADGVAFVGPSEGEMACGEFGPGRMAEPLAIVDAAERALAQPTFIPLPTAALKGPLSGRHVLVTAGPTFEPIDPVRFIGNRSSGLQGFALAQAALDAGARVTLIRGPVALADPKGAAIVRVETAQQMLEAVRAALPADVFIAAAAVADWRVEKTGDQKLKKGSGVARSLSLVENADILAEVAKAGATRPTMVIGFAAETENVLESAKAKLSRKGCDLIVANSVAEGTGVFGGSDNQVHIVSPSGSDSWPRMSKAEIAEKLIALVALRIGERE
jgi:phosphopantothenoylcysteine decarboxylase/phosphopantothenate--cysteine ligase